MGVRDKPEDDATELVARLVHDLRNPIGVMLSFAEMIPESDEVDRADFCARLVCNAQRALHLLDDYSLLWDLGARRIEATLDDCAWPPLVRAAAEEARSDLAAPARRLVCIGEEPALLRVDGGRLRQAVRSLVRDALRGVGSDGAVRVDIRADAGTALLEVAIDADRAGSRGLLLERDSLGASLARHVAVLHGGAFVLGEAGQGLIASLRLPRRRS
jgi:signal transduction histidine kinase